jgi:hypothetical protein
VKPIECTITARDDGAWKALKDIADAAHRGNS